MKKRDVLVLLVLLTAISIVGAAGTKETAAAVQSGAIGSVGNPVKVTYLCKDVDPITDAQQLGMLEKAIEEGMMTLRKDGINQILSGVTTAAEVLQYTMI